MADRLDPDAIEVRLAGLKGWRYRGGKLQLELTFEDFSEAFGFLCRVALLAERADHHPELRNVHRKVWLSLTTHDADGVTAKDFELAKKIDMLLGK